MRIPTCSELMDVIAKNHFEILKVTEDEEKCVIDFRHPTLKYGIIGLPPAYYNSSVYLNKNTGTLEVTVRRRVDGFKELYLEGCCENGINVCRPHVDMEEKTLSVEAKFHTNVKDRLNALLTEMYQ